MGTITGVDAPRQTDQQRRYGLWPCVLAIAAATPLLVAGSHAPWWAAGVGVGAALSSAAAHVLLERAFVTRQTFGELTAGVVAAVWVTAAAATGGLELTAASFAGAVLVGHVTVCAIWQTSAFGVVLGALSFAGATVFMGGSLLLSTLGTLAALGVGLAVTGALAAERERGATLARQLRRTQGDLVSHHSVEQELRATHDSLERQAQALSDSHRRMEREVEARRRAEEQALEVARIKDSFLHIISHELRTPLNAVIGYTEILLEEDPALTLQQTRGDHEKIQVSANRLLELIDDLLDLAKIEAGKAAVAVEPVELAALAEHVLATVAGAAEANRDTLRLRCEDGLPPLHTDRGKLRRILLHLLGNACKFTHDGVVRLTIRHERSGNARPSFVFEVSDTGIGMDADTLARIFTPFTQADASTTRRYEGTGLGLAICGHYCGMLGGQITALSRPGEGSTFTVRLPAERVDPRASGLLVQSNF